MNISSVNSNIYYNYQPIKKEAHKNVAFTGGFQLPRMKSPLHDDFSSTGNQIIIRSYLSMKNEGKTTTEIFEKTFDTSKYSKKEYEEKLKKFEEEYIPMIEGKIKKLDDSFKNIVPIPFKRTYYRGISGAPEKNSGIKVINEAKKGDVIVPDVGYAFVTLDEEVAKDYATEFTSGNSHNPKHQAVLKMIFPSGSKISRNYLHLKEGVIPRGAKYEVLDKQIEDGKTYITLQYLPEK